MRLAHFALLVSLCCSGQSWAGGKKTPEPSPSPAEDGKKIVEFRPVLSSQIELPDGKQFSLGEDFRARLTTLLLASERFLVADPSAGGGGVGLESLNSNTKSGVPDFVWAGTYLPAASLDIDVEAMSFVTGTRGDRTFYGFNDRILQHKNEFPIQSDLDRASWFGNGFDAKGDAPYDSRAGLDLGTSFNIDFLIGWLAVKHERYRSRIRLRVTVKSPWTGTSTTSIVDVTGKGYFWDVAGGYEGYDGGFKLARRDALLQAFRDGVDASLGSVIKSMQEVPRVAKVDHVVNSESGQWVLLGTGHQSQVRPGVQFRSMDGQIPVVLEVALSNSSGSVAKIISGLAEQIQPGQIYIQADPSTVTSMAKKGATQQTRLDSVVLAEKELPKSDFSTLSQPSVGRWYVFIKNLQSTLALPYRIWRFYQYDQPYESLSGAQDLSARDEPQAPSGLQSFTEPSLPLPSRPLKQIFKRSPSRSVVVALMDSGVDYNHPNLRDAIWINPSPSPDWEGNQDRVGWDFISNDPRPYDDAYHGTQVAGLIHQEAPEAKILPLKVFNPWGITTSGALLSAFRYAVAKKVDVIVCPWASILSSEALEAGVALAAQAGIPVITSAGDDGFALSQRPSYPASFANKYPNLHVVAALGKSGGLLRTDLRESGYDPKLVNIAVFAEELEVLEPRSRASIDSGTGLAAGVYAGALARALAQTSKGDLEGALKQLESRIEQVPALADRILDGRVLRSR